MQKILKVMTNTISNKDKKDSDRQSLRLSKFSAKLIYKINILF